MNRSNVKLGVATVAIMVAGILLFPTPAEVVTQEDYLADIEVAVLREHNLARTQPDEYADYVEEWLRFYKGHRRRLPGRLPVWTTEGRDAVNEAVAFLRLQEPLPPLQASPGLARAAQAHVRDSGPNGGMGHIGGDGSEPADRVSRFGTWFGRVGENITYGGAEARELVIRLIIDDGVKDRGHRRNIFNREYRLAGVSFGRHESYGTMCVVTYAAEFDPDDN